jgi:hypothetical protein
LTCVPVAGEAHPAVIVVTAPRQTNASLGEETAYVALSTLRIPHALAQAERVEILVLDTHIPRPTRLVALATDGSTIPSLPAGLLVGVRINLENARGVQDPALTLYIGGTRLSGVRLVGTAPPTFADDLNGRVRT